MKKLFIILASLGFLIGVQFAFASNYSNVPVDSTGFNYSFPGNVIASGTVSVATSTASGTVSYGFTTDQSSFLNLNVTGNSPGSGSTGTLQEYNILEQNCPYGASTSNQAECTISQSLSSPYGLTGRVFVDHTLELYAPTYLWGDFITATNSSTLPEYVVEFTDHTNNHAQPLTITPVNSSTNSGFNIGLGTSGSTVNVTGNQTITGNLSVGTTTSNGNLYVSSAGTNVVRLNRGANTNFNLLAFSTGGNDDWNFGEQNNSTNNFVVQDAANGGTVIQAIQNGTTTLGVSGTGATIVASVALAASTTLSVNQTTTLRGNVVFPNLATSSFAYISSTGNLTTTSTPSGGGGGGSGNGNLFVTPTSSVLANNVAVFQTAASSTIKATSSIYSFADGGVSINTSTENGLLNAVNSNGIVAARFSTSTLNATSVSLSVLGASSTAASNFSVFQVLADGHINSTGTIPTVSSCGSGAAVIGTDSGGTVSIGSGVVTACTLTFQIPYETSNLFVLESDNSTAVTGDVTSVSNTAVTFGFSATLGGGKLYYFVGENL